MLHGTLNFQKQQSLLLFSYLTLTSTLPALDKTRKAKGSDVSWALSENN